jgi:hypothetical protein
VLQLHVRAAREDVIVFPTQRGAVTARIAEAMQDGGEYGTFDVAREAALLQQRLEDSLAAGVAPEAFEDEGRPETATANDGNLASLMGGQEDDVFGEAGAGGEQGVELAGVLE